MAIPSPASEAARLTAAFQAAQARRAAAIAALVVAYYRSKVDPSSTQSVENWLRLMVPRILRESNLSANQAALYANTLRRLEVPDAPRFTFTPFDATNDEQVRTSLLVVGPEARTRKFTQIKDDPDLSPVMKQAMIRDLDKATQTKIGGTVARHTQNGARETIGRGTAEDKTTLGWVRVTRDKPCYFCALLASRGLQSGYIYSKAAFEDSDARFVGTGDAKVHDHCQCHLKPVYSKDDDYVKRAEFFESLYREASGTSINAFRAVYESAYAAATTTT